MAITGVVAARVAALVLVFLAAGIQPSAVVEGELVLLITLTRHGSRVSISGCPLCTAVHPILAVVCVVLAGALSAPVKSIYS